MDRARHRRLTLDNAWHTRHEAARSQRIVDLRAPESALANSTPAHRSRFSRSVAGLSGHEPDAPVLRFSLFGVPDKDLDTFPPDCPTSANIAGHKKAHHRRAFKVETYRRTSFLRAARPRRCAAGKRRAAEKDLQVGTGSLASMIRSAAGAFIDCVRIRKCRIRSCLPWPATGVCRLEPGVRAGHVGAPECPHPGDVTREVLPLLPTKPLVR